MVGWLLQTGAPPKSSLGHVVRAAYFYVRNNLKSIAMNNEARAAFRRTPEGLLVQIYSTQKESSRNRNHPLPNYTKDQLRAWLFTQPRFYDLFHQWVDSGFKKDKVPSCDRIDNSKPYTLDNLQLGTWRDNLNNANRNVINGTLARKTKSILQIETGKTFHSLREAARQTPGAHHSHISDCCRGKRKTSGGFSWSEI